MLRSLLSLAFALGLTLSAARAADPVKTKPAAPVAEMPAARSAASPAVKQAAKPCDSEGRCGLGSRRRQAAIGCGSTGG